MLSWYPSTGAIMPRLSWKDLPRLEVELIYGARTAACQFLDLLSNSLGCCQDELLASLMCEFGIICLQRGNPLAGLMLIHDFAGVIPDSVGDRFSAEVMRLTKEVAKDVAIKSKDNILKGDALYVIHCTNREVGADVYHSSELEEAATLGQPFALFDLARIRLALHKDVEAYISLATRAIEAGSICAALDLIEQILGDKTGAFKAHRHVALDAAKQMAVQGLSVGMLDLALQSEEHNYAMFLAAAEEGHSHTSQALWCVLNDKRFLLDENTLLTSKKLEIEDDRHRAIVALRQASAKLFIERVMRIMGSPPLARP